MISPYLQNDGWKELHALKQRRMYLETSLLATKYFKETKNPIYAFYAKEFHDEAFRIIVNPIPE